MSNVYMILIGESGGKTEIGRHTNRRKALLSSCDVSVPAGLNCPRYSPAQSSLEYMTLVLEKLQGVS
jgi:hypothetical protein